MSEINVTQEGAPSNLPDADPAAIALPKAKWEAPRLEDVSEQVMAQPYIRFT
jgi:hypothetical protein